MKRTDRWQLYIQLQSNTVFIWGNINTICGGLLDIHRQHVRLK